LAALFAPSHSCYHQIERSNLITLASIVHCPRWDEGSKTMLPFSLSSKARVLSLIAAPRAPPTALACAQAENKRHRFFDATTCLPQVVKDRSHSRSSFNFRCDSGPPFQATRPVGTLASPDRYLGRFSPQVLFRTRFASPSH